MKFITVILLSFALAACGKSDKPSQPAIQLIPKAEPVTVTGYDKYLSACMAGVKDEIVCRCQANLLKKNLPDEKIMAVADFGTAINSNDKPKLAEIMKQNPDIPKTLEKISLLAENCPQSR